MARAKSAVTKKADKKDTIIPTAVPVMPEQTVGVVEAAPTMAVVSSATKRQETSKTKSRAQIVPNTVQDEIRMRAYELYVQRGYSSGNPTEDWLDAEREVMQRYNHHHSA